MWRNSSIQRRAPTLLYTFGINWKVYFEQGLPIQRNDLLLWLNGGKFLPRREDGAIATYDATPYYLANGFELDVPQSRIGVMVRGLHTFLAI